MIALEILDRAAPYTSGQTIKLDQQEIKLGRYDSCQLSFDDQNSTISREHAVITHYDGDTTISNLSQTNTTLVNGKPVQGKQPLNNGDVIQLSSQGPRLQFKNTNASQHKNPSFKNTTNKTDYSVLDWYKMPLKKYATFKGRASRKEYWTFFFLNFSISWGLIIFDIIMMYGAGFPDFRLGTILYGVMILVLIVPTLAVMVRRLHDTGRSAAWILIALIPFVGTIVLLIFLIQQGATGTNQYGPSPI